MYSHDDMHADCSLYESDRSRMDCVLAWMGKEILVEDVYVLTSFAPQYPPTAMIGVARMRCKNNKISFHMLVYKRLFFSRALFLSPREIVSPPPKEIMVRTE